MKLLHILNELRPSGAEVMLRVAAPYWLKIGIQPEILSTGDVPGSYALILEKVGYPIHHLPFSPSFSFLKSFYEFLNSQKYDVVHLHAERANFWLALVARLAGVSRLVRTIHNVFPFEGKLGLERRLQRWLLRSLGVVHVSIGPSVKGIEWEYFRNPTVFIPNWYDTERFVPPSVEERSQVRRSLNIEENTFVIVSVGNCSKVKNHATILQALANVAEKINFLYLHIGQEEHGNPERKLAEELTISGRVRFLGFIEDILPILQASDVFIMPSLNEGFSIAAVEAMAVGIPAILADVPGLRDLKEIASGLLWIKPDPVSMTEALLSFAKLPKDVRKQRGMTLHHAVCECFGVNRGVNAYTTLYMSKELEES